MGDLELELELEIEIEDGIVDIEDGCGGDLGDILR